MDNSILIDNIFKKINFKIKPNQNIRKEYFFRLKKRFYKIFKSEKRFITSNASFSNTSPEDLQAIKKLSNIDTMSQIAIGFLINQICKNLSTNDNYLNIGVWRGFSMFAGMLNTSCKVYGVDNFSFDYEDGNSSLNNKKEEIESRDYFVKNFDLIKNNEKHFFFDLDYKKFFEIWQKEKKEINFYFYDGEHSYKNQYENLIIAMNFFKKGTIILVDDYNEVEVDSATKDFLAKYNKDFKVLKDIKTANKYIHPTYANGIILFEKIN